MEYCLENEFLRVTVTTAGAQVKSVLRKEDAVEHMWQADPEVWGFHAPILFPYTGRLKDNRLITGDRTIENTPLHGFARDREHTLVYQNRDTLVLQLTESPETLAIWPWRFRLLSAFTLEGDTLRHTLTVENRDEVPIQFGIGFHPAFNVPFDDRHTFRDYELRFDALESPLCLSTWPRGLITGETYCLGNNLTSIPIDEALFAADSHCMVSLNSNTLGIYEKDSGRAVVLSIQGFPYCLLWSKPGEPQFVCIEPWNSLPSREDGSCVWEEKPAAARLAPGESFSTVLTTAFRRNS